MTEQTLPWVEKYRPKTISDIISHETIIRSLKNFILKKTLPHMLFFGPPGSGKTSTIMCCAYEIYGKYEDCMILRLNASNERGIDTVRTKIKNFVTNNSAVYFPLDKTIPGNTIFKLVILDEIDSMTVEAQGMLRQSIEKNSDTTRFCLICNNIDKISPALQSRCALFHFSPLQSQNMEIRLNEICKLEHIKCDDDAIASIIKLSNGDMRTAINILQSTKLIDDDHITTDDIYRISGYCMSSVIKKIFKILLKITSKKISLYGAIQKITNIIVTNNITIFNLLDDLQQMVMNDIDMNNMQKIYLIDNFANHEKYDSVSVDAKIIIMNIASLFILIKN